MGKRTQGARQTGFSGRGQESRGLPRCVWLSESTCRGLRRVVSTGVWAAGLELLGTAGCWDACGSRAVGGAVDSKEATGQNRVFSPKALPGKRPSSLSNFIR